jgi:DNA-binding NarL/FixJ family response regulator
MINVVTVDPHEIVRTGLKTVFSSAGDIEVVGEAQDAHEAFNIVKSTSVQVLITELSSIGRSSMDLIRRAKDHDPATKVMILTAQGGVDIARRALKKAGASGFLTKDAGGPQIIAAVRRLATGHVFVSDEIAEQLVAQFQDIGPAQGHRSLTERELDVLVRLARGESCSEIARAVSLSVKTISTHKARIMTKMHFSSTADIVQYAVAHKLVQAYVI